MHSFTLSHTIPRAQTTGARTLAHFLRPVLRGMICALLVAGLFFAAGPAGQPVEAASSTDDRAKPTFASESSSPAEASRRAHAVHAVVINEINYNAPNDAESGDWIELYNAGTDDADLTGWKYSDEDDAHVFTFPDGTVLKSGAYLVVAQNIADFAAIHPGVSNVVGDADFGLAGGGELVRIFDASGAIADSLTYDDKAPWPEEADGGGYTLALADPTCDNYLPECWKASPQMHGSPGAPNFPTMTSVEPVDGEIPAAFALEQNYPNPFNPSTTIRFSLEQAQAVTLTVYDMLGREVRVLADGVQPAGNYSVSLDGANLAGGTYLYVLRTGQHVSAKKMTLLK